MWIRATKQDILRACQDLASLNSWCTPLEVSRRVGIPLECAQMALLRAHRQGLLKRYRVEGTGCGPNEAFHYYPTREGLRRLAFFDREW